MRTDERIDFMSTNAEAYRQLEDGTELERIREVERRLSARARYYVPGPRVADVASPVARPRNHTEEAET